MGPEILHFSQALWDIHAVRASECTWKSKCLSSHITNFVALDVLFNNSAPQSSNL